VGVVGSTWLWGGVVFEPHVNPLATTTKKKEKIATVANNGPKQTQLLWDNVQQRWDWSLPAVGRRGSPRGFFGSEGLTRGGGSEAANGPFGRSGLGAPGQ